MHTLTLLGVAIASGIVVATPTIERDSTASSTVEPCAVISQAWSNGYTAFDADTAYACLQSVPLDVNGDLSQIRGLQILYQFQSDLSFLKNPPPGFLYPAVDVLNELDLISQALQSGQYSNEYDFQVDLYELVTSVYDFHTNYPPDIVKVFTWGRAWGLISISSDGLALPNVYVTHDLQALESNTSYTASPVTAINGVGIEDWLNTYATLNPWDHDPDANYNNVFLSIPNQVQTAKNGPSFGTFNTTNNYQGNDTVITFANKTEVHVTTFATITNNDFSGVVDGPSFFQKFCTIANTNETTYDNTTTPQTPEDPTTSSASLPVSTSEPTQNAYTPVPSQTEIAAPYGYPDPFVAASDLSISGYFPEEQDDLAVLVIPTFDPTDDVEWQNTFRGFLATSKAEGKTRLIIDVRANGGGTIIDGYDMFKQLFPDQVPFGAATLAAFPLVDAVGQVISYGLAKENLTQLRLAVPEWNYNEDLTVNLQDYDTWSDFYGPQFIHGGNYTNLDRYNLSDAASLGAPIYGYIDDTQPQPQTFDASNITILSDGLCGSTCAVFAEFMKSQVGVEAIAVGGRSQPGPMQWVGGSKGSNVQTMPALIGLVNETYAEAPSSLAGLYDPYTPYFGDIAQALARLPSPDQGRVNFKNNIREGDNTQTPLQFVYEAADCRFFYTADMIVKQSLVWDRAYQIQWKNASCVAGSASPPSSLSGSGGNNTGTGYINSPPPSGTNNTLPASATFSYPFTVPKPTGSGASTKPSTVSSTGKPTPTPSTPSTNGASGLMYGGLASAFLAVPVWLCFV